jgi:hypothetical protein
MSPSTSTVPQYSPTSVGQKDAAQLVRSLESHVAFIEGDPALQEDLELYYYRIVRVIFPLLLRCPDYDRISLVLLRYSTFLSWIN